MRATDLAEVAFLEKSLYAFPWSLGNFRDSLNAGYDCWSVTHGETVIGYAVLMIALDEAHLLNVAIAEVAEDVLLVVAGRVLPVERP